ncbi:hypothetical protein AVEN_271419-1 [Araneus ventricosus]|uniref:Uncharacterized protein n=1 Tax=Araneus ventricosus TaxID=182803 RepID=A0A4Y2H643_ARAVE|nr:hypothetical protein AVEN_271419-1 [Araneus ventricosus]
MIIVRTAIWKLRMESQWPSPTSAQLLPQEVHSDIGVEETQCLTITIPTREARTVLLIRRPLTQVFGLPPTQWGLLMVLPLIMCCISFLEDLLYRKHRIMSNFGGNGIPSLSRSFRFKCEAQRRIAVL